MELAKLLPQKTKHKKSYLKILNLFVDILSMKTFGISGIMKIDTIESKLIISLRDELFPEIDSLDFLLSLISSIKNFHSKFDIKLLANLLCDHYSFFQNFRDRKQTEILNHLITVLNIEYYREKDKIILFEDIADKFYIILRGTIGIYRPQFYLKEMTLESFCNYLYEIKYNSKDFPSLARIEQKNEMYSHLVYDVNAIKQANYQSKYLYDDKSTKKEYYVEENFLLSFGEKGIQIGDMAFLSNTKRNATIICLTDCIAVSLSRANYLRIMKEINYKELLKKTEDMQKDYFIFKSWSRQHLIKLMNFFSTVTLVKGDLLYNQDDQSDYIYFSQKGLFECYTNISVESYQDMIQYINDTKGSIIKWIKANYFNSISRHSIAHLLQIKRLLLNQMHSQIEHKSNVDDNANKELTLLKISTNKNNGAMMDYILDSKREHKKTNNPKLLFKVKIRKINEKECFGIEEAFDCKNRFSTIKCISSNAEVFRINVVDLIQFICEKKIDLREISMLIEERKQNTLVQLNNYMKFESKQVLTKTNDISRNNQLSAFENHNNNKDVYNKVSSIRITKTNLNSNCSSIFNKKNNNSVNSLFNYQGIINNNVGKAILDQSKSKETVKIAMSTSQKHLRTKFKMNVFSEKSMKKKKEEFKREKERETKKMLKYMTALQQKDFNEFQKEIFYMAGFHKINMKKHIPTEDFETLKILSPQEKTFTILNSFSSPLKSRNDSLGKPKKKNKFKSINNLNKNKSALNLFIKGNESNVLNLKIEIQKQNKLAIKSGEDKYTQN